MPRIACSWPLAMVRIPRWSRRISTRAAACRFPPHFDRIREGQGRLVRLGHVVRPVAPVLIARPETVGPRNAGPAIGDRVPAVRVTGRQRLTASANPGAIARDRIVVDRMDVGRDPKALAARGGRGGAMHRAAGLRPRRANVLPVNSRAGSAQPVNAQRESARRGIVRPAIDRPAIVRAVHGRIGAVGAQGGVIGDHVRMARHPVAGNAARRIVVVRVVGMARGVAARGVAATGDPASGAAVKAEMRGATIAMPVPGRR